MSEPCVFVSFDIEHDAELYERLMAESKVAGFSVSSGSERVSDSEGWRDSVRRRIREADQVIVICGGYTEESVCMSAELRIAQEERTPYFLLWGRREIMCHKPVGAKASEGMYAWTREILMDQVAFGFRRARALANAPAGAPS